MEEKVCIFIDGTNFSNTLRDQFGDLKVDYHRFSQLLCKNRILTRIYYYTASYRQEDNPDLYARQQKFFNYLRRIPYLELRLGRKEKRPMKFDERLRKDFQILIGPILEKSIEKISKKFGLESLLPKQIEEFKARVTEIYDKEMFNKIFSIINKKSPKIVEKGVDIALASEMIDLVYRNVYDTAILVSGDGDYVQAVETVKRAGKHVENAFFEKAPNIHLRNACDIFVPITKDFINKCSKSKNP